MGCWNETCGMSHLPITHGEDVVLFVLQSDLGYAQTFRNLSDMYHPVGLPLYGKYDDYGSIEPDTERAAYHDMAYRALTAGTDYAKVSEHDFDTMLQDLVRDEFNPDGVRHGQLMIKRSIWESMIGQIATRKARLKKYPLPYSEAIMNTLDNIIETHKLEVEEIKSREYSTERFMAAMKARDEMIHYGSQSSHYQFDGLLRSKAVVSPSSDELRVEILEGIRDLILTSMTFDALRLGWVVQVGSGSQDAEFTLAGQLASLVLEEVEKDRLEMLSYEDYDEDESIEENSQS